MAVTLVNPFQVFAGREGEFLALWDLTGGIFRRKAGYVSARLVKALPDQPPGQHAPFTHVNIAVWETAEAYAAALADPEIRQLAARHRAVCTFQPALYATLRDA